MKQVRQVKYRDSDETQHLQQVSAVTYNLNWMGQEGFEFFRIL